MQEEAPAAAKIISFEDKDLTEDSVAELKAKFEVPAEARAARNVRAAAYETSKASEVFAILPSKHDGARQTLISPDLSICPDCLRELFDSNDRRFHYPFINCTNCGPRFTIINDLPYDRYSTSMYEFAMCETCAAEYDDEENRRYHAQPNACFECGPELWFVDADENGSSILAHIKMANTREGSRTANTREGSKTANTREASDELIAKCAQAIQAGKIAAVKGLGGWHLICDARNESAVQMLRERKHRPSKPLAIMVRDVSSAKQFAVINGRERELLESRARPIVLFRRIEEAFDEKASSDDKSTVSKLDASLEKLAPSLVDDLPEIGIMLPTTPVQYLLLEALDNIALVATSANKSGEPILADDKEALEALQGIADVFLGNNRAITTRYDDSVVRVHKSTAESACKTQLIRRARGYAPVPLLLRHSSDESAPENAPESEPASAPVSKNTPGDASKNTPGDASKNAPGSAPSNAPGKAPTIFACGSQQKATFTFLVPQGKEQGFEQGFSAKAFTSQHLGDLEHAGAWKVWLETKHKYEQLFDLNAQVIGCDLHPEYISSKWARDFALKHKLPLVEVQHHHAHIASVMGENSLFGQVIGVALDGTGYGEDGKIWGCEVLIASRANFERFWHLPYFYLPSGAGAIYNPERCAYGLLTSYENYASNEQADTSKTAEQTADANQMYTSKTDGQNTENPASWLFRVFSKKNPECQRFIRKCDNKKLLNQMIKKKLNCPECSSLGRLFDASAVVFDITAGKIGYDGEPACLLEAVALMELDKQMENGASALEKTILEVSDKQPQNETLFIKDLLKDPINKASLEFTPLNLHVSIAKMIIDVCENARKQTGLNRVCLSGGCMVNRLLNALICEGLAKRKFEVFENIDLPPNDACISFGQAIVAQARLQENV